MGIREVGCDKGVKVDMIKDCKVRVENCGVKLVKCSVKMARLPSKKWFYPTQDSEISSSSQFRKFSSPGTMQRLKLIQEKVIINFLNPGK